MHNNQNIIVSLIHDIQIFDPKSPSSGRYLTKEKLVIYYVTDVEIYCCTFVGINIVSA